MPAGFTLTLFGGCGGSGEIVHCCTAPPMSTPVLWLTWVEGHSPSLDLGFGRVSCCGWRYSGWNAKNISSEFGVQKSSLFCFSSRPLGPSRGREVLAHLLVPGRRHGRAPHGLQTSSKEQYCPATSLQDQPGPVTTDAYKETQGAPWVEASLDTLSSELPPWESSASWAKGRLPWANIIRTWWGVTPRTRASVMAFSWKPGKLEVMLYTALSITPLLKVLWHSIKKGKETLKIFIYYLFGALDLGCSTQNLWC